jgi:hypothetical protein
VFAAYDVVVDHQVTSGTVNHWWIDVMSMVWLLLLELSRLIVTSDIESLASGGSCSMGVLSSWWLGIHRRLDSSGNFWRFLVMR